MATTKVKFDKRALFKELMTKAVEQQSLLLVQYAQTKIIEIGDTIKTWHSVNNMDRTGHLLDSLCWGVSYNKRLVKSGFYRTAMAHGKSYLHEWFGDTERIAVNGHSLAKKFISSYGHTGDNGWMVFFAILAPYWGYWEKGFVMRNPTGSRHLQFSVMTQFYDQIKQDLQPARVELSVSVAKYDKPNSEMQ